MTHYRNIREQLKNIYITNIENNREALSNPIAIQPYIDRLFRENGIDRNKAIQILKHDTFEMFAALSVIENAKTILFSAEQAEILHNYKEPLDYRLPYEHLLIQFTRPVKIEYDQERLIGLLLAQEVITEEVFERSLPSDREIIVKKENIGKNLNAVYPIFENYSSRQITWVGNEEEILDAAIDEVKELMVQIKNLAIACIGYINCENIVLELEEVPEKVNRKREKRNKARLEPYYICRIKKSRYDSGEESTHTGSSHGYRYDVRGHFRRLSDGRTTWVKEHKRGLKHELYIPKTYYVEKEK